MENQNAKKGTTTVGLVCSDGIVFAADKRASMGHFIAAKEVDKIHQIADNMALTIAGSVADAQTLVRVMQAELKLYKMRNEESMSVSAATTLLSNIMFQYKMFPFFVQLLLGGVDSKPAIYNLDPLGGVTSENIVSTGSGSPMAYGLLEDQYEEGKPIKENANLAVRAIATAMKRDSATGESIDLVHVDKRGFKRYGREDVKKILESLKKA
ncbi:proteasome endopeptidase complex, archaeal, beta subunit [Candidatus Micrarchaeota archaeon]|nr:MAG: proteasome endopeptidase complex, archaeal, beta subunit [Candidatus Micrarchaeota archaeon]